MDGEQVHVFLDVNVRDPEQFGRYLKGYQESFRQYGGETVFVSRDLEAVQGDFSPDIVALQRWPSERAYRDWVDSPEYRPWKKIRDEAAVVRTTIAR